MNQINRRLLSLCVIDQKLMALIEGGQQFSEGDNFYLLGKGGYVFGSVG